MRFDGVSQAYMPPEILDIDPSVQLHRDAVEVEPITYEVLRHSLWSINEEHGESIIRASGSPIAAAGDFNPTICLEDGEILFSGPYTQFMSGTADLVVKWTLENRSESPGIREGDMYLCADPWIGTPHQMDSVLLCPVFVDGQIFCWMLNTLHLHEFGGTTPGSFCPDAPDVFWEPTPVPSIKIVEGDELRRDVEQMLMRTSRMAQMLGLDLRSQIAGATVARTRMQSLIARYGATVVKGAMRRIVDTSERVIADKLRLIPDGTWRDVLYTGVALPGDRTAFKLAMTLQKVGDRLIFDDVGTDPAAGSLPCVYCGWRSAILAVLNSTLGYDELYATGGVARRVTFNPTPGSMTCADHPAAVSMYTSVLLSSALAARVVAKMLVSAPELKPDLLGPTGFSTSLYTGFGGLDRHGDPVGTVTLDQMAGGLAGFPDHDGISSGGVWWHSNAEIMNVEIVERTFPMLHLYRREVHGGGGHGAWRGGDGVVVAWTPHKASHLEFAATSAATVTPPAMGLFGAAPGSPGWHYLVEGSEVRARLGAGEMIVGPDGLRDVGGTGRKVPPKVSRVRLRDGDILEMRCPSAGGYGDPLRRDPALVVDDVLSNRTSARDAERLYGVVVTRGSGALDEAASARAREQLVDARRRAARLAPASADGHVTAGEVLVRVSVHEYVDIVVEAGGSWNCCNRCDHRLGPADGNYRLQAATRTLALTDLGEYFMDPAIELDAPLVVREFLCPSCVTLFDVDVARSDDPIYRDLELDLSKLAQHRAPVSAANGHV